MWYFGFTPDRYRGNSPIQLSPLPRKSTSATFAAFAVAVVSAVAANRVVTASVAAHSVSAASTVNAVAILTDNIPFFRSGARARTSCMQDLY